MRFKLNSREEVHSPWATHSSRTKISQESSKLIGDTYDKNHTKNLSSWVTHAITTKLWREKFYSPWATHAIRTKISQESSKLISDN